MPATVAGPGTKRSGAVLDGVLERVTFANPETGYTIARIAPERGTEHAAKILDVPPELIAPCLDQLAAAGGVVCEAVPCVTQVPAVYLPPFYQAERAVAQALLRLPRGPTG